jgi:hypothetical protein
MKMNSLMRDEMVSMARRFATYPEVTDQSVNALVIELTSRLWLLYNNFDPEAFINECMLFADKDRRALVLHEVKMLKRLLAS